MPNFARLQIAFKNVYVRILTAVLLGMLTGWAIYKADIPQDPSPVVHSQNISEITQLAAQKDRLDYLLVAKPLSDAPRYIYKFKGAPELHVVKVPSTSHLSLEREVLLKNAIPYSIAKDEYLASHKAVLQDEGEGFGADVARLPQAPRARPDRAGRDPVRDEIRHPGHGHERPADHAGQAEGQHGRPDRHGRHQAGSAAPGRHDPQPRAVQRAQHRQAVQRHADRPGRYRQDQAGGLPGQAPRHPADPGLGFGAGIGLRRRRLEGAERPVPQGREQGPLHHLPG